MGLPSSTRIGRSVRLARGRDSRAPFGSNQARRVTDSMAGFPPHARRQSTNCRGSRPSLGEAAGREGRLGAVLRLILRRINVELFTSTEPQALLYFFNRCANKTCNGQAALLTAGRRSRAGRWSDWRDAGAGRGFVSERASMRSERSGREYGVREQARAFGAGMRRTRLFSRRRKLRREGSGGAICTSLPARDFRWNG